VTTRKHATKYDWETISQTFIEGLTLGSNTDERKMMNLKEIAEHYGAPYETVRAHSAAERWSEKRSDFQARLAIDRQKARIKKLSDEALRFDETSLNAAKLGQGLIAQRLSEIVKELPGATDRRNEAVARLNAGLPVEKWELYPTVNYRELDGLSKSLAMFQQVGQRALGTDVQKHEITGADGGPIGITGDFDVTVNIKDELLRDDSARTAAVVKALQAANLIDPRLLGMDDIEDAELVDEAEDAPEEVKRQLALPPGMASPDDLDDEDDDAPNSQKDN
jgi:hypothetical protein